MNEALATLVQDADDELPGGIGCVYYLVRRLRIIIYDDVTPGLPVQVRRYPSDDDLIAAWLAIEEGDNWGEQGVEGPFD